MRMAILTEEGLAGAVGESSHRSPALWKRLLLARTHTRSYLLQLTVHLQLRFELIVSYVRS